MRYSLLLFFFILTSTIKAQTDNKINSASDSIESKGTGTFQFFISNSFTTHSSYLGRDYGYDYNYLTPTLLVYHKSGISLYGSAYFLMGKSDGQFFDGGVVGLSYDYEINDLLTASIGYSRGFYADSSKQAKSINANSVYAELTSAIEGFTVDLTAYMDFGGNSEFAIDFMPSYEFTIEGIFGEDELAIEPGILFTWGSQNETGNKLRKQKTAGVNIIPPGKQNNSMFGILSYEPNLSFTYKPVYFPLNLRSTIYFLKILLIKVIKKVI